MPSAEAFDAFTKLSATALAFIAIFALYTRRVRTKGRAISGHVHGFGRKDHTT